MKMKRTTYSAKFKSDRVLEVIAGDEQLEAIASRHNLNPNMLRSWKKSFLDRSYKVFDESREVKELASRKREYAEEREELLKTVGQLTLERDWLKKKAADVCGSDYEKRFGGKPF